MIKPYDKAILVIMYHSHDIKSNNTNLSSTNNTF